MALAAWQRAGAGGEHCRPALDSALGPAFKRLRQPHAVSIVYGDRSRFAALARSAGAETPALVAAAGGGADPAVRGRTEAADAAAEAGRRPFRLSQRAYDNRVCPRLAAGEGVPARDAALVRRGRCNRLVTGGRPRAFSVPSAVWSVLRDSYWMDDQSQDCQAAKPDTKSLTQKNTPREKREACCLEAFCFDGYAAARVLRRLTATARPPSVSSRPKEIVVDASGTAAGARAAARMDWSLEVVATKVAAPVSVLSV